MAIVPIMPVSETQTKVVIEEIRGITDETLRWIITIFMSGYRTSAREAPQKVMHAIADMAGISEELIPLEVQKRINDLTYEVLVDIAALEARTPPSAGPKSDDTPTSS